MKYIYFSSSDEEIGIRNIIINKEFIQQNGGRIQIGDVVIQENIDIDPLPINLQAEVGEVDEDAPETINNRALGSENSTRVSWKPKEWIAWIDHSVKSGINQVFGSVSSTFGVPKLKTEYVILSKTAQLSEEDVRLIRDNLDQFEIQQVQMDGETSSFYWTDTEAYQNRMYRKSDVNVRLAPELIALIAKVGTIVVTEVNKMTTVEIGGRYSLDEKGYWFMKHGDKIDFVQNEYNDTVPKMDLEAGDTYFFFGSSIDLNRIGLGEIGFSCAIDKDFNFTWNGKVIFNVVQVLQNGVIDVGKWIYNHIAIKIWNLFSSKRGTPVTQVNRGIEVKGAINGIKYPGISYIGPSSEELNK